MNRVNWVEEKYDTFYLEGIPVSGFWSAEVKLEMIGKDAWEWTINIYNDSKGEVMFSRGSKFRAETIDFAMEVAVINAQATMGLLMDFVGDVSNYLNRIK